MWMWLLLAAVGPAVALMLAMFLLRLVSITKTGRRKEDAAPPLVLDSPVVKIPLFGTALEFGQSPVKMVRRCYEQYGPVFTVPMAHKRLTFLIGPEAQETFFKANDEVLSQDEVYDFMKPVFGPDVIYDASRKHRQMQLQSTANGLRNTRLKAYVAKIERETRLYLKQHWSEPEGEVDLLVALSELTILTASRCLHGDDVRESIFKEVSELYHDLDHGLTPLTVFWPNAPTAAHKKRDQARKQLVELFSQVIAKRRRNEGKSDGTDILEIFMNIKYKDGTMIQDEQVTGLLIALLFAGQHTSCITSTWTSLFIANDPSIWERVLKEQESIFGKDKNAAAEAPVDFDSLNEMELLHNCMREALRLCPPLILLIRKAMRDVSVKLDGGKTTYTIPKNDMVLVSPSVGMRLPDVFANPETFDPDRYAPPREEHKIPYAYMGFGGGMHSCMGQNFAFVQVKTILSILFRQYEIERIAPDMPEIDYAAMVVGPKGNCRVKYKKRV